MSLALVLGLVSALAYGTADFAARFAARAVGVWRTMFYNSALAALCFGVWLLADPGQAAAARRASLGAWVAAGGSGLIVLVATSCLLRGLAVGRIVVVAPVTASYGAVTALLSAAAGERMSAVTACGMLVTILGVGLASIPRRAAPTREPVKSGLAWALASSLCYGVGLWLQGVLAVPMLGPVPTVFFYYVANIAALAVLSWPLRLSLRPPPARHAFKVAMVGVCGACGYAALTLGFAMREVAVVTVLSTLASLVAVLLSRVFAAERVAPHQWLGALTVVAGLVLINGGA